MNILHHLYRSEATDDIFNSLSVVTESKATLVLGLIFSMKQTLKDSLSCRMIKLTQFKCSAVDVWE